MNDLSRQIQDLRLRLRLQMLLLVGVLTVGLFTFGGADVVARVLIESDAWKIRTNNAALSLTDRLIVTTDVDTARIKVVNANIELAQQATMPATTTAGALWYDNSSGKLKYRNGSGWVEVGGSADTWRLEFTSATTLTLRGIGNGGGSIDINGSTLFFATNPTLTAPAGTSLFFIYAYSNAGSVALEASATVPTVAEYGVYGSKTADATRRFVGMAYTTSSQFTDDMVRSVKNHNGYGCLKKYAPAAGESPSTSLTTWSNLEANGNLARDGLFFDKERVRVWSSAMSYVSSLNSEANCRLGVSVAGVPVDDSEVAAQINRGTAYALPNGVVRAEAYVTTSGAGLKNIRAIHKTESGGYAQWNMNSTRPASVGFEVLR